MISVGEEIPFDSEDISVQRRKDIVEATHRTIDAFHTALLHAGRSDTDARLLAATKTRTVGEIMAAIDAGIRLIGENRPQEVQMKSAAVTKLCLERGYAVEQHLIGQLQKNKINKVLPFVSVIESVESFDQAYNISSRAEKPVGIFLEVNTSGEATKSGCLPDMAQEEAQRIAELPHVELRGLMTIGAHTDNTEAIRLSFRKLRHLRDIIQSQLHLSSCTELSMGMSGDYPLALEEGATIVRLGTAIFGPRFLQK